LKRAKVRTWVDFFNSRVHPTAGDIRHQRDAEKAARRMKTHLETLDQELAGKDFIVDDYSLADVTFIPFYTRRERYGVTIDQKFSNVIRWGENLIARPAVAATL
ncbi:MAG: glutathione binding-like protein, partial [Deltaproteobacteria bacterium]|nr:glutathione binding-like protein [Deltaproteobacteria bacterium]